MPIVSPTTLVGARSPIYITANYSSLSGQLIDVTLEVYIWNAARGSRPATANYTLFRDVFVGEDVTFDIGPLVEEYIVNDYDDREVTAAQPSIDKGVWWVQVDYDVNYYDKADPPAVANDTGSTDIFYSSNGYHTFAEEANYEYPVDFLHTIDTFYVQTNGIETVKVHLGNYSADEVYYIGYLAGDGTSKTIDISSLHSSTQPEGRIVEVPIGPNNLNDWLVANSSTATPPTSRDRYTITILDDGSSELERITIEKVCEPKYDINEISYINRYGVWDYLHFFKRSDDDFSASSSEYRKALGSSSSSGFTYDKTESLYTKFNTNGKTTTTLNSGWVLEEYREAFKDLLLSERVLLNGSPVNVTTTSLRLSKSINDKMINYTIQVTEAFDTRYV